MRQERAARARNHAAGLRPRRRPVPPPAVSWDGHAAQSATSCVLGRARRTTCLGLRRPIMSYISSISRSSAVCPSHAKRAWISSQRGRANRGALGVVRSAGGRGCAPSGPSLRAWFRPRSPSTRAPRWPTNSRRPSGSPLSSTSPLSDDSEDDRRGASKIQSALLGAFFFAFEAI